MTYLELIRDAEYKLEHNELTFGEYNEMIEPLRREIKQESKTDWISVSERLPNRDEYIKNNGLFIVSDGNRSYFEWFDIYDRQNFGEPTMYGFKVDYCVIAWKPLPEPYKAGKRQLNRAETEISASKTRL